MQIICLKSLNNCGNRFLKTEMSSSLYFITFSFFSNSKKLTWLFYFTRGTLYALPQDPLHSRCSTSPSVRQRAPFLLPSCFSLQRQTQNPFLLFFFLTQNLCRLAATMTLPIHAFILFKTVLS